MPAVHQILGTPVEVPAAVLVRARKHLEKTGQPLLLRDRRRRGDWALVEVPGNRGFTLLLDPESPPAQAHMAMGEMFPPRSLVADLAQSAAAGLEALPRRFTCEGTTVGIWEIVGECAWVRGPVALTLLSRLLREQRIGFYVRLPEIT